MNKIYFMIDNALKMKEDVKKGGRPPHIFYGGFQLEKDGKAKILDYTLKNILTLKPGSIVVTNRTKYVIPAKLTGKKIILINMNSNHDLILKPGFRGKILFLLNFIYYHFCNKIICLSEIQLPKLSKIGIRKTVKVIPLGIEDALLKNRKKSNEFYLSSGFDKGRNYNFIKNALKGYKLKILDGSTPIPYNEYLNIVAKAKAIVLNVNINKKESSDLSGVTTCTEGLLFGKPIYINPQPFAKELFKENYYFYTNEEELKNLLKSPIKFKKANYDHLKLSNFSYKLMKEIEKL